MPAPYYRPHIDFRIATCSYFFYSGVIYNVTQAPTDIFKAAVLEKVPHWRMDETYGPILRQDELDKADRWWLLCALAEARQEIELYDSQEAAYEGSHNHG
jgi:hypothetical protein